MKAPRSISASAPLVCALCLCVLPQLCGADVKAQTVVAERTSKAGVRVVLGVDADDNVREVDVGLPGGSAQPEIWANLGTRVVTSGSLTLAGLLPKGQVATLARRVSLDNGTIIHIVITWGFAEDPHLLRVYCHLYAFREQGGMVEKVADEELGSELEQLVVEDVNRDGKTEILAVTGENEAETMYVWQIELDGEVQEIQRIEGYHIHALSDNLTEPGEGILVEEKVGSPRGGLACYEIHEYIWSPKQRKFLIEH